MGPLRPTGGRVLVDGADLHDPSEPGLLASWQKTMAHVPQSIHLAVSSIAENIALGIPREQSDHGLVKCAAEQA